MASSQQKLLQGTVLKMALTFSYPSDTSLFLEDLDFYTEWYCSSLKVRIEKEAHVFDEDGQCFAYVNTSEIGKGRLKGRLWVNIPDDNAPGGSRAEFVEIFTTVVIS